MTAPAADRRTDDDRTAMRLGRIVIIGMAILEAIAIGFAIFSNHSIGVR